MDLIDELGRLAQKRLWPRVTRKRHGRWLCWEWTGYRQPPHGYGTITVRQLKPRGPYYAHRLAWIVSRQRLIPPTKQVLHRCDNPPCIRPSHLFLGTHQDNMDDMMRKGRQRDGHLYGDDHPLRKNPALAARGESHGGAKLTARQVQAIRRAYSRGGVTQEALARQYHISRPNVSGIVNRRLWRHLP